MYFFLTFLLKPVHTNDFWWHLATGKYIVEHQSLPESDPFSFTAQDTSSKRKLAILRGNWLAETVFYTVYGSLGLKGIVLLRSTLLLLFLLFVFLTIRKRGGAVLTALLLTSGVFLIANGYSERPQLFTFLVFSMIYYLLESFKSKRTWKILLIPPAVALAANAHPGYIVCILLVSLYCADEGIRCLFRGSFRDSIVGELLVIWVLSLLFSMLNPNGAIMLSRMFSVHGEHTRHIVEWMSPFQLYAEKLKPVHYPYIAFLLLSLPGFLLPRKIGITHMLLLSVFTIMSIISMRYMIFYMAVAAPVLSTVLLRLHNETVPGKLTKILEDRQVLLNTSACIFGIFLVVSTVPSFSRSTFKASAFYSVPQDAADFLEGLNVEGNMFNARGLDVDILDEYHIVASALEYSPMHWKEILKKYNITYSITSPLTPTGEIFPVIEKLFISEEWLLIYSDHLSLIFLRNDSRNQLLIKQYAKDKSEGLNTILAQASAKAMKTRNNPRYLISVGKVLFMMKKPDEAEKAFRSALQLDHDNSEILFWLNRIRKAQNSDNGVQ
jgi:hypothetical protein